MTVLKRLRFVVGAFVAIVGTAGTARADAIDGDWCSNDGRNLRIVGSSIITPAGTATSGTYSRHAFTYVAPSSDPDAGRTVDMVLLNENNLDLQILDRPGGERQGEVQRWIRCQPAVS